MYIASEFGKQKGDTFSDSDSDLDDLDNDLSDEEVDLDDDEMAMAFKGSFMFPVEVIVFFYIQHKT